MMNVGNINTQYTLQKVIVLAFRAHTWNIAEYTHMKVQEGTGRHRKAQEGTGRHRKAQEGACTAVSSYAYTHVRRVRVLSALSSHLPVNVTVPSKREEHPIRLGEVDACTVLGMEKCKLARRPERHAHGDVLERREAKGGKRRK